LLEAPPATNKRVGRLIASILLLVPRMDLMGVSSVLSLRIFFIDWVPKHLYLFI